MNSEKLKRTSPAVFWLTILIFAWLIFFWLWLYTFHRQIFQPLSNWSGNLLNYSLISGLLNAFIFGLLFFRFGKLQAKDFWLSKKSVWVGVVIGIGYWVALQVIILVYACVSNHEFLLSNSFVGFDQLQKDLVLFPRSVVNAFVEELVIRGFLFTQIWLWLRNKSTTRFWSVLGAASCSALLFAIAHLPSRIFIAQLSWDALIVEQIVLLGIGMISALFYWRTRNLAYMILVHALTNSSLMLFKSTLTPQGIAVVFAVIVALFWPKIESGFYWRKIAASS